MDPIQKKQKRNRYIIFFSTLIYLVLLIVGYLNLTRFQDYLKLYNYDPPVAVSNLADQVTMNSYTRHLFYLNKPKILDTVSSFRSYCSETKNIIVLGCYQIGQKGIYLYKVDNPLLSGINQVTAAHEVLHSVYERLSDSDRKKLNSDLQYFYDHELKDTNVKAEVALYIKYEPNSVYDEMSCTFGTELAKLSPALEKYYSKYFTNRLAIYNYYSGYESQFNTRIAQIYSYDNQLTGMNNNIKSNQDTLNSLNSQLNTLKAKMDALKFTSTSAYNAQVTNYNNLVNQYNDLRSTTLNLIDSYNQIVKNRNDIATQLKNLDEAINTTIITSN